MTGDNATFHLELSPLDLGQYGDYSPTFELEPPAAGRTTKRGAFSVGVNLRAAHRHELTRSIGQWKHHAAS